MPVISVDKDPEALTMTFTAELDASVDRSWLLWADPRQLERWWGPPGYPATVVDHDLVPDGRVSYYMTGPDGQKYHGYWRVVSVEPPRRIEFVDGFADDTGAPNADMPATTTVVTLTGVGEGRSRMVVESRFPSLEALEQLLSMGVEEGMRASMGQLDALVSEPAS